jgi:hypothetical protein
MGSGASRYSISNMTCVVALTVRSRGGGMSNVVSGLAMRVPVTVTFSILS